MTYLTACKKNTDWPKTRLICGQVEQIKEGDTPRLLKTRPLGDWSLLAQIKD